MIRRHASLRAESGTSSSKRQALNERERLVQQTVARRSAEIDARAKRFDEIAADLDARDS